MKHNNLTYTIDQINFRHGHIQLNAYREDGSIENTYPVIFSLEKEIEETKEITTQEKYIAEEIQTNKDGVDFLAKVVKTRDVVTTAKTGNTIPNPNYIDPRNKKEIESFLVEKHWFTL